MCLFSFPLFFTGTVPHRKLGTSTSIKFVSVNRHTYTDNRRLVCFPLATERTQALHWRPVWDGVKSARLLWQILRRQSVRGNLSLFPQLLSTQHKCAVQWLSLPRRERRSRSQLPRRRRLPKYTELGSVRNREWWTASKICAIFSCIHCWQHSICACRDLCQVKVRGLSLELSEWYVKVKWIELSKRTPQNQRKRYHLIHWP